MAVTQVQTASATTGNTNSTSLTVTLGAAPAAGNLLVAFWGLDADGGTFTLPDANWATARVRVGTNSAAAIFYLKNCGTATSYTFSWVNSGKGSMQIIEFAGADTSAPLDQVADNTGTGTATTTGTTAALAGAGELGVWCVQRATGVANVTYSSLLNSYTSVLQSAGGAGSSKNHMNTFENLSVGAAATSSGATASVAGSGWTAVIAAFKPASAEHTVTVTQVTETDAAQTITAVNNPLTTTVTQTTETDAAQTIVAIKTIVQAVGQVTETDVAQIITAVNAPTIASVTQTTETDVAQTVAPVKTPLTVAVGVATETNTAQNVVPLAPLVVGQVTETDTAQTITAVNSALTVAVGQTTEVDTAQPITAVKIATVGASNETDLAQPFTFTHSSLTVAVGQVAESDTAMPIDPTGPKVRTVTQVTETDTAQTIVPIKTIFKAIQQITETDTSQTVVAFKQALIVTVGQAIETDIALVIAAPRFFAVGQAIETDFAFEIAASIVLLPSVLGVMDSPGSLGANVSSVGEHRPGGINHGV